MKTRTITLGLMVLIAIAGNAVAGQRGRCCDPVAANIQARCCQGTLLPYHEAIQRADDATKAEAALAAMTDQRNAMQVEMARLQEELKSALAARDKAVAEKVAAVSERDKAVQAEAASAKAAKEQEIAAGKAKAAMVAAQKAQKDAEAAAAQAKDDAAKQVTVAQAETKAAMDQVKKAVEEAKIAKAESEKAAGDLKKVNEEIVSLKEKLVAATKPEVKEETKPEAKKDDKGEDKPEVN